LFYNSNLPFHSHSALFCYLPELREREKSLLFKVREKILSLLYLKAANFKAAKIYDPSAIGHYFKPHDFNSDANEFALNPNQPN
jgi:hypothetical protein